MKKHLFLGENGASFLGSSHVFGDEHSGMFLKLIELLSMYDPMLAAHTNGIKEAQNQNKRLQFHYLSPSSQNEFINLCSREVQNKILDEVRDAKYFSIIVDATPDVSHHEQIILVVRYVQLLKSETSDTVTDFCINERFLQFDSFNLKTGEALANCILSLLDRLNLDFKMCVGQAYDNGANMSGKAKGVQARLKELNPGCLFSACGCHSLNLVGVRSVQCCPDVITFFGMIERLYVLFSCSPAR